MDQQPLFPFLEDSFSSNLKGVRKKRFLKKIRVLRNLYVHGPASNSEIGKRLKISLPTSLAMMNELLEGDIIQRDGHGVSSGGRKPVLYGLKEDSFFSLGIDVARHNTRMAIYNNSNIRVSETISFTSDITRSEEFIDLLCDNSEELIQKSSVDTRKLICAGIIMPGLIDSDTGVNQTHLNFEGYTLREVLEKKFNRPVFLENDAKAMAHAELRFGKAKGRKNVLVVYLEWGLGLGVIIEGKIYRGSLGFAGELSHTPAVENKIYCQCGKQGCLETVASGAAIARLATEGIEAGKKSVLSSFLNGAKGPIDPGIVIDAANKGDLFAISVLSDVGMNLGRGLASLIQLFNPELVILSGKVCKARQYITTPIQQSLNTYCMPQLREETEIVISDLDDEQGMLGAATMALEYVFDKSFMLKEFHNSRAFEKESVLQ